MHYDKYRVCVGVLLGVSVLLNSAAGFADKPKAQAVSSEWQRGKRFATTRRETHRLGPGTVVELDANSAITVQPRVPLPTSVEGLGPFAYAAQLTSGRIDVDIDTKQRNASGVLIFGPRRTSVLARGGHVSMIVRSNGLVVGVYDGREASVSIGSTWKHIAAGKMLVISAEAPQGLESKMPQAPTHVGVDRPVLAMDGVTEPVCATWDPVPEVQRYLVSLVNTETHAQKVLEASQPKVALLGLEPGRYAMRVSSAVAAGLESTASEPAFVNVVGVQLPPGAFVSQGKIYLESLQQLSLTNVDGLEATYDRASVYFKASNRASLRGTQATTLHLRVPGSSERASLELLPRALHTQIDISPTLARWPRDKVVVKIQLPRMPSDAPEVKLVPSVTVNNQTVELEWVRSEQDLESVIPAPPNYPGPWVLRVEVADQHGVTLGRNFLEIASTAGLNDEDIPREIHRGTTRAQAKR
jgi:hypothetical protein